MINGNNAKKCNHFHTNLIEVCFCLSISLKKSFFSFSLETLHTLLFVPKLNSCVSSVPIKIKLKRNFSYKDTINMSNINSKKSERHFSSFSQYLRILVSEIKFHPLFVPLSFCSLNLWVVSLEHAKL